MKLLDIFITVVLFLAFLALAGSLAFAQYLEGQILSAILVGGGVSLLGTAAIFLFYSYLKSGREARKEVKEMEKGKKE